MARVRKNFQFPSSRRMKYSWDKWLDGQVWELDRGTDYQVGTEQMRRNVYSAAWSRGIRVRTHRGKNMLTIQAFVAKAAKKPSNKDAA